MHPNRKKNWQSSLPKLKLFCLGSLLMLIYLASSDFVFAQLNGIHPRGLLTLEQIASTRAKQRLALPQFYLAEMDRHFKNPNLNDDGEDKLVVLSNYTLMGAGLYFLKDEKQYLPQTINLFRQVVNHKDWCTYNIRGLEHATILMNTAQAYDLAYNGLPIPLRDSVNRGLALMMRDVAASMGKEANYALESNWMGVRWATVLFTAAVVDGDPAGFHVRSFEFDSRQRLFDHLRKFFYKGGAGVEGIGYLGYDYLFSGTGLIALRNKGYHDFAGPLGKWLPEARKLVEQLVHFQVNIPANGYYNGLKIDLADDNALASGLVNRLILASPLQSDTLRRVIRWHADAFFNPKVRTTRPHMELLHAALFYPAEVEPLNPSALGFNKFIDADYGLISWRNRYQDRNDALVVFNTSAKRVSGHQGPDNLTFRITAFGVPWVVGAGRTGQQAGQTNFFPSEGPITQKRKQVSSTFLKGEFSENGFLAEAMGSCMDVKDHKRRFKSEYLADGSLKITIRDSSANGGRWRMNTPEMCKVERTKEGFRLMAPNGAILTANFSGLRYPETAKGKGKKAQQLAPVRFERVKYGGDTERLVFPLVVDEVEYPYGRVVEVATLPVVEVTLHIKPKP